MKHLNIKNRPNAAVLLCPFCINDLQEMADTEIGKLSDDIKKLYEQQRQRNGGIQWK